MCISGKTNRYTPREGKARHKNAQPYHRGGSKNKMSFLYANEDDQY